MVPKPNGTVTPILDLKDLNQFLDIRSFRMESIRSVVSTLQGGEFLASIDIKDAYLHVPIFPAHQRFLRFAALSFSLATAPRVFTKILALPLAKLRARGITVTAYLDNLLLVELSIARLDRSVLSTVEYLQYLG